MELTTLATVILLLAPPALSKEAVKAAPQGSNKKACLVKMEKTVRDTATTMGLKMRFGFQFLNSNAENKDFQGKPLLEFSTGVFITDNGYLSHSGATVLVRETANACDIVKLSVAIGG